MCDIVLEKPTYFIKLDAGMSSDFPVHSYLIFLNTCLNDISND